MSEALYRAKHQHRHKRRFAVFSSLACGIVVANLPSRALANTTATWTNVSGGNWSTPSNWSTNPNYPNNGTPAGTLYDVVFPGSATLDVSPTVQNMMDTGVTNGTNTLTINGLLTANNCTTHCPIVCNGGIIIQGIDMTQNASWINSAGQTATLNTSGASGLYLEGSTSTFTNSGVLTYQGGTIFGETSSDTFNNTGTVNFTATMGNGSLTGGQFTNSGALNVQAGTLIFVAGYTGTSTGAISISLHASLDVSQGFGKTASVSNSGAISFTGTGNVSGAINGLGSITVPAGGVL